MEALANKKTNDSCKLQRNAFFDNLKAIEIFLVVFHHGIECIFDYGEVALILDKILLSFTMPVFVFTTGVFSKSMATIGNPTRKRIVNYIVLYSILQIILIIISVLGKSWSGWTLVVPYYTLWYLAVIIIWYSALPYLSGIKGNILLPVSVVCGILIGLDNYCNSVLQLNRMINFLPFFMLGYYMSERWEHFEDFINKRNWRTVQFISLVISLLCIPLWIGTLHLWILHAEVGYTAMGLSYSQGILQRSSWYLITVSMGLGFLALVPRKKTFFTFLGERTLAIYVVHTVIYWILRNLTPLFQIIGQRHASVLVLGIMAVAVTFVCGNKWVDAWFKKIMAIQTQKNYTNK